MKASFRWQKILLELIIFVIFLLLTAFALLRAYGYKYDAYKMAFLKTSIVDLSANLKNISVNLDGKHIANALPYQINGLMPGHYDIRIEKGGYLPWEAELTVEQDKVYRFDSIVLVPLTIENVLVSATEEEALLWDVFLAAYQLLDREDARFLTFFDDGLKGRFVNVEGEIMAFSLDFAGATKDPDRVFRVDEQPFRSADAMLLSGDGLLYVSNDKVLRLDAGTFSNVSLGVPSDSQKQITFLSRTGSLVSDLRWYQHGKNILFRGDGDLRFCDVQFVNCYELLKLDEDDHFFVFDKKIAIYRADMKKWSVLILI